METLNSTKMQEIVLLFIDRCIDASLTYAYEENYPTKLKKDIILIESLLNKKWNVIVEEFGKS